MINDKNYVKAMVIKMLPMLAKESADIESLKVLNEAFIAGVVAGLCPFLSEEEYDDLTSYSVSLKDKVNVYLDMAYEAFLMSCEA